MSEEIELIVQDEKEKTYILEVKKTIKYEELKRIVKETIVKTYKFDLIYKNKKYTNSNEILYLSQGDKIYIESSVCLESNIECNFHKNVNLNEADMNVVQLSGILQLCLLKYIASCINNLNLIKNDEIREIIRELKEGVKMTNNPQKDIYESLSQTNGNNILTYINYLQEVITTKEIKNLIILFDKIKQNQIIAYWSILSKYQDFNILFEKEFSKMIEKSYFDFSLIGISIFQHRRRKEFITNLKNCSNCEVRYLLHGTQVDPISKIITTDFLYTKKAFYGMGIYFSDMIDYISFYSEYVDGNRTNWAKITPVGKTISCVGAEIFYDKDKKKYIYHNNLRVPTLDHFPSYDELKANYKDKMVEKNGIHFVRVEPKGGDVIKESDIEKARKEGKFIGTEYVITEMDQILPLYGLTFRRNEYFIIWRDGNFKGENEWSKYLKQRKMFIYKEAKMNVFFESNTEKAIELIKRKKYNKVILISSWQGGVGKKFVDVVRKILNFDIVVLFYSANQNNLNLIQKYPNALYTNGETFYKKYITNYNLQGLFNLKSEMEQYYGYKLNLNNKCLDYPYANLADKNTYETLIFEEISPYFRKVIIKNKRVKKSFMMEKGKFIFGDYVGKEIDNFIWYITMINGEMTLFSNDLYLTVDNNKNIIGSQWMTNWRFEIRNNKYLFYLNDKNNVLTLNGNIAKLESENPNKIQIFELFDIIL